MSGVSGEMIFTIFKIIQVLNGKFLSATACQRGRVVRALTESIESDQVFVGRSVVDNHAALVIQG